MLVYQFFFFFNDTATTEIYTLSLHDALPISTLVRINAHRDTELRHVLPLVNEIEQLGAQDVVLVVTPEAAPPSP